MIWDFARLGMRASNCVLFNFRFFLALKALRSVSRSSKWPCSQVQLTSQNEPIIDTKKRVERSLTLLFLGNGWGNARCTSQKLYLRVRQRKNRMLKLLRKKRLWSWLSRRGCNKCLGAANSSKSGFKSEINMALVTFFFGKPFALFLLTKWLGNSLKRWGKTRAFESLLDLVLDPDLAEEERDEEEETEIDEEEKFKGFWRESLRLLGFIFETHNIRPICYPFYFNT